MSALLCNTSVIIFMLGLVAEQVASLRLEKSDGLSSREVADSYDVFREFVADSKDPAA
jgi:hypothetical protein